MTLNEWLKEHPSFYFFTFKGYEDKIWHNLYDPKGGENCAYSLSAEDLAASNLNLKVSGTWDNGAIE